MNDCCLFVVSVKIFNGINFFSHTYRVNALILEPYMYIVFQKTGVLVISKCCELVKLCHIDRRVWVFETQYMLTS